MKNLRDSISIATCTSDSKVTDAIYIHVNREIVCLEEDFQEGMTFCKDFILNDFLNLKQLKLKTLKEY
jgi:hypothetical protein